jgi:hypothetical protein
MNVDLFEPFFLLLTPDFGKGILRLWAQVSGLEKADLRGRLMQIKPIKIDYVDQSYSCQDRRSQNTSNSIKEEKD